MSFSEEPVHQIVFRQVGATTTVSCYCRAVYGNHVRTKGGGDYYEPMTVDSGETAFEAYNRRENHFAPFGGTDRIRT